MIQQYSPFIIYAMWLMFNKMAEICVAILDDWLFFFVFLLYYLFMKPDIFEIFSTFLRYLEKKLGIS